MTALPAGTPALLRYLVDLYYIFVPVGGAAALCAQRIERRGKDFNIEGAIVRGGLNLKLGS
jgi:hypothetical protein